MSRKIKFRMWDAENSVMIDGDSLAFEEYAPITTLLSQEGIMQYTGLKDKNGKPIYEGDIVEWWDSYGVPELGNDSFSTRAAVIFNNGGFDPVVGLLGVEIEVIGNIYQNPDLLKP